MFLVSFQCKEFWLDNFKMRIPKFFAERVFISKSFEK